MIDEHAVAGADRGGDFAQAEVGHAVLLDVLDDGGEEAFAWRQPGLVEGRGDRRRLVQTDTRGHLTQSSTTCTMWYMYRMVHEEVAP